MTIEIRYKYVLGQRCAETRIGPEIEDFITVAGRTWAEAKLALLKQVEQRLGNEPAPKPETVDL